LSLRAHRPENSEGTIRPIVAALMGQGGNVTATDRLRGVLRKKIKKYSSLRHARVPLVLFIYEGNFLHISRESLEWALFGNLRVTFSPNQAEAPISLEPGGLFLPGPSGQPQNTRLSAVVYGRHQWLDGAPYATLFVYHHPSARNPIPHGQFAPLPQCRTTIREETIEQHWSSDLDGAIEFLSLA
jgi:hypothetical protein